MSQFDWTATHHLEGIVRERGGFPGPGPHRASRLDLPPGNTGSPLARYLRIIRRHAYKISAFVAVALIATYIISARLTPLYVSVAIIDVDRQAPSAVIGQESYRTYQGNSLEVDQFLATQVRLIESDAVLRPVAEKYDLVRIENEQQFERPWKRFLREDTPAGTGKQPAEAPVSLKRLKITRLQNTYLLLILYQSPDPNLAAAVANGIAESYLQNAYNLRLRSSASLANFMEKQMVELRTKMEHSSGELAQIERELGVITLDEKTNMLTNRLLQFNTEYANAQSDRAKKEAIWSSVRTGSLESLEVSGQAEQLTRLSQMLNNARQHFAQVKATYGSAHPEYRKASSEVAELLRQIEDARINIGQRVQADYTQALARERIIQNALEETKAQSDRISSRYFSYQQLQRAAESDKKLYEEMVRKIKEGGINAGFQDSNIRIADVARPGLSPVFPKKGLNLLLAFLFSGVLAVGTAVLGDALNTRIRDPEQTSRLLATNVIGTLPAVKNMGRADASRAEYVPGSLAALNMAVQAGILRTNAQRANVYGYAEAIRALRNTITLAHIGVPIRSIVITSASLGEGKTTTAVNLGIAQAEQGKSTLLIDADLRYPSIHRRLGVPSRTGLLNVLAGQIDWADAVRPVKGKPNLFVIPAGLPSNRASDVIGPCLVDLLRKVLRRYDFIVIDAPPLLGFAEALHIASLADGVLVVTRADHTKIDDAATALSLLSLVRANVIGMVINRLKRDASFSYGYYAYADHLREREFPDWYRTRKADQ
jgi:succinoglycan biosynthesis transport protein ExoP